MHAILYDYFLIILSLKFLELKNCYDCFDLDKSGSISGNELEKVFKKMGMVMNEKEVHVLLNLMDSVDIYDVLY